MKRCRIFASLGLCLGLAACLSDRPAISVDQARQITATFSKTGFVAPPRTVNDILALLDQEGPDPARVAASRAAAEAAPPPGLPPAEQAAFFQARGLAAGTLGRTGQQIADLTRACELAEAHPGRVDLSRLLQQISFAHMRAGNRAEAVAWRKRQLALHEESGANQGRLFGIYASQVNILADQGDLDEAQAALGRMVSLLGESHTWRRGVAYSENGAKWEAQVVGARAALAERRGTLEEAERLRRAEIAALDAILVSPDGESQRFLVNRDQALRALARVLAQRGRPVEAEIEARRALLSQLHEHGRYAPETAEMLLTLTGIVAQQGRWRDAEVLARATIDIYRRTGHGPASWSLAQARANLAMVEVLAERPALALDTFRALDADLGGERALRGRILDGNPFYALALSQGGEAKAAAGILRGVAESRAARLGPDHPDTAEARGLLAAALVEAGGGAEAEAEALSLLRQAMPVLLSPGGRADSAEAEETALGQARRRRLVFETYVGLLARAPATPEIIAETFRTAEAARAQAVQRSLAASAARAAVRDPAMADLIRREQDTGQQLAAHRAMLADQMAAASGQRDEALLAALRPRVEALQAARDALRREVAERFPAYERLRAPAPAGPAEVQAALHEGEALVAILVGRRQSFVWGVPKRGRAVFATVPMGEADVAAMVRRLRAPMEAQIDTLGDLPAFDLAEAHRAFAAFLAPVEPAWGEAGSLVVVADRALGQLPFPVLVTEPARLAPDPAGEAFLSAYRAVPWLARRAAVTQIPSSSALISLRHLPPGPAGRRPFIGFADPWFNAAQAEEGRRDVGTRDVGTRGLGLAGAAAPGAASVPVPRGFAPAPRVVTRAFARRALPATRGLDTALLGSLPRLPETADEVLSVARALKADPAADVFLGDMTAEGRILSMPLADRRVVMFATHGLVPGDIDGLTQPALAMSSPEVTRAGGSGLLTMDNVLGLKLDADWVVLSACNTAAGDSAGGEAVSGLGRAFFYAGTRAVLVTHWAVESGSAAALTTGLFRRTADDPGLSRAEALRRTMLALIDGPGAVDPTSALVLFSYAHPVFWAPYALVGDGG